MSKRVYLSSPHMGGTEQKYVQEAFDENWIAPLGPNVNNFEKELCDYTGARYAAALSSGTAALHLALILSDVGKGDEVLVSTFTFSASVNPIIYQGATPVFVESEADTWNMSPEALEEAIADRINQGKKPKAIILVHLYGQPAKVDEIKSIADKHEIILIEDAAESMGAYYKGEHTGTFGQFGIYSFNGNKIITTSGGGALVGHDEELIQKARFLATQARDPAPHYQHSEIGYNYRMSNIVAGIGRGQLEVLDKWVELRRNHYEGYKEALGDLEGIDFLSELAETRSNRWLTCITLKHETVVPEEIRLALEEANIESRPLWKPMHLQPIFEKHPYYGDGLSERLFEKGLCLPSGSNMSVDDRDRVIDIVKSLIS